MVRVCTYAVLGDTERALELLESSGDNGWYDRQWLEHDPDLAALRDHPRFNRLLERMRPFPLSPLAFRKVTYRLHE